MHVRVVIATAVGGAASADAVEPTSASMAATTATTAGAR